MKIKIKNVFAADPSDNGVTLADLQDDKTVILKAEKGEPNSTISCRTKTGYPVFINMPKTACLAISFSEN
jgi:hypothetical protein